MKSTTCKGSNGQYLEEYHSEASASFAVKEIKKDFGHDLTPYLCRTCDYWHLKALSTSKLCTFCTDSALFQKDLYATREDADI